MHNGSKPGVRSRRHTCTERSTFSTRAASANAAPIARWRRREPVGRGALPATHEKILATCSLPENQNLCHGVFRVKRLRISNDTRADRAKRSAKENDRQPLDIPRNREFDDFAGQ